MGQKVNPIGLRLGINRTLKLRKFSLPKNPSVAGVIAIRCVRLRQLHEIE